MRDLLTEKRVTFRESLVRDFVYVIMDASNAPSLQSEPDQDNSSSLQNQSTNPAEAGTEADETRDDDHETSSIEALNWDEEDEAAHQAQALAAAAAGTASGKPLSTDVNGKNEKEEGEASNKSNSSSTNESSVLANDEGSVLSTSLLQSINSSVSDEDPQARKLSVIENWASEVTNAVERGEMEMEEDFPDESGIGGDGDDDQEGKRDNGEGMRKRIGKRVNPDMVSSVVSSAANTESNVDPLSNASVLDDGPIWNKGPRSYTFQENRRINQKLTFCLLIAVVLAIGLGLGNLVAHQECEAEYKASQQSQITNSEGIPNHHHGGVPTTTTPAPIIPQRSTDSSVVENSIPRKRSLPPTPTNDFLTEDSNMENVEINDIHEQELKREKVAKRDEPIIDPKYKIHAETVSNVVHTLDKLSRRIDEYENTTRKLQGVLMIPDEESETTSEKEHSLYDENVHVDEPEPDMMETLDDEFDEEDEAENAKAALYELIDAIEQTPRYLEGKRLDKRIKELEADRTTSSLFARKTPRSNTEQADFDLIMKSIQQFQDFQHRFIKSERKRIIDDGKFHRLNWREPEEYTEEEKTELDGRYKTAWEEFIKLAKSKHSDPVHALFGDEEELVERTYGDVFHYPWPDPEEELTDEEASEQFQKNINELWFDKKSPPEIKGTDEVEIEEADIPDNSEVEIEVDTSGDLAQPNDDLIILEQVQESVEKVVPMLSSETKDVHQTLNNDKIYDDGKSTSNHEAKADKGSVDTQSIATTTFINTPTEDNNNANSADKETSGSEVQKSSRPLNKKTTREASPDQSMPKINKSDSKSANSVTATNLSSNGNKSQSSSGNDKSNKRDYKQKEKKVKKEKESKQKGKVSKLDSKDSNDIATAVSNPDAGSGKVKMSSKGKKLKNLESNKAFENVKGKNIDKRRSPISDKAPGEKDERFTDKSTDVPRYERDKKKNGKKALKDSTNYENNINEQSSSKEKRQKWQKQNNNGNQPHKNNRGEGPTYYDPRDQKDQQQDSRSRETVRNNDKRNSHENKAASKLKYENQDFSKETQYRQHKQEFNSNYENRHQNDNIRNTYNGKKSKNWQHKEKAERSREKASSWNK